MKKLIYILTLLTIGNTYAQSNIKVNEKAPPINITDWIENVPSDKNLSDKYIVLEFWATWCGPCIAAVPHMNKIQQEFNQKDLYYISITDESIEKVERTLKRIDFKSIVVTDLTTKTQINFGDGIKGLEAFPLTVLIDKSGVVKWIGEPKDLNPTIMSVFLSNGNQERVEVNFNIMETAEQKESHPIYNFKELFTNKELKYYFDLQESKETETIKQSIGTSIIKLQAYKLKDIYNEILKIKNDRLELPERFENKQFDLMYKNTEKSENFDLLENDILKKLNLEKTIDVRPTKTFVISIQDQSLLEETLEKMFSAKSDADDTIIFTAYTLDKTLDELSNVSPTPFIWESENETKYDFIIGVKSETDIVNSLKSYGLAVAEKYLEIEYLTLIDKE